MLSPNYFFIPSNGKKWLLEPNQQAKNRESIALPRQFNCPRYTITTLILLQDFPLVLPDRNNSYTSLRTVIIPIGYTSLHENQGHRVNIHIHTTSPRNSLAGQTCWTSQTRKTIQFILHVIYLRSLANQIIRSYIIHSGPLTSGLIHLIVKTRFERRENQDLSLYAKQGSIIHQTFWVDSTDFQNSTSACETVMMVSLSV